MFDELHSSVDKMDTEMSVLRWLVPGKARRVLHPMKSMKRRLTPKPVRTTYYVRHPLGTASSAVTRSALRRR